ncbi:glyoxalase/bleomycin resistance/extradiol dioxygenase family protein [Streptomyces solincola]|uniref:Glyoxalase/bleomycin resistance/extradiol dioxygenase family protein n=1 Tax=Streptomyces solincola TaxID=2100817 RepID=A0A2S9PRT4_9ACTN|nr:VOC family protein [Streptomyces solincola]PRH77135.1 glyoxalase/bleomycin resistance/extradiol dioxygenase family protein [Streptomyces solincola]
MTDKTIPLLPCHEIQPVVDFYTALGFETTCLQKAPYAYAVVRRGPVELQFFAMKGYEPSQSYSGCYVLTDDVNGLHSVFRAGLKAAYGRIPSRGLPRIGPLKDMSYGVRQFLMTDPGGNSIRVGQPISDDPSMRPVPKEPFARALHLADLFADSKEDLAGAARLIDRVLPPEHGHAPPPGGPAPTPVQHVRLLVLRADLAARLGDAPLAAELAARAAALPLGGQDRAAAADSLSRLAELTEPMS